jgi:hypothetical protein
MWMIKVQLRCRFGWSETHRWGAELKKKLMKIDSFSATRARFWQAQEGAAAALRTSRPR